jgi:hypothetical protein
MKATMRLSDQQQEVVDRLSARQLAGDDSRINFNDIPELTEEQLSRMVRTRYQKPSKGNNLLDTPLIERVTG